MTGLIDELLENDNQLQIINGELEKVINRKKEKMLQESDLIELLDGVAAFGKRTQQQQTCLKPVVWALLGAQLPTYVREMGSESNGRLRFVISTIDSAQVQTTAFEEKLVPRNFSNQLLVGVLREILVAQHPDSVRPPTLEEDPEDKDESQEGAKRKLCLRKQLPKRARVDVQVGPPAQMQVTCMHWSPSATLVLAGVMDGSGQACDKVGKCPGSSMVTKHAGKAFGAMATANVAMRNGLLRWAVGEKIPFDTSVRILDCLAAVPKMEMCSVNQWLVETLIMQKSASEKNAEIIPDLSAVDFAARRLFDGLARDKDKDQTLMQVASEAGIPLKVNQKTVWYNFRQLHFSRTRKRQEGAGVSKRDCIMRFTCVIFRREMPWLKVNSLFFHPVWQGCCGMEEAES